MRKQLQTIFVSCLFICGGNFTKAQTISTIAGNGTAGFMGDGGPATSCELHGPYGTFIDRNGNIYIADALNHRIRKINTVGVITTIAGTGVAGYSGDGSLSTSAQLNRPTDVAVDSLGNVYIADELNFVVRKINPSGIISTCAGTGVSGYTGDGGLATAAQLTRVNLLSIDKARNLYISLYEDNVIRKVNAGTGIITTIAGTGVQGFSGDGGLATSATFYSTCKVAFDNAGNIYIADEYNQRIRKINTSGIVTTVAGTGAIGFSGDGGLATSASLNYPEGIAVDISGNLYISDKLNERVRKVTASTGIITTIAGTGAQSYTGDGGLATSATLYYPEELSFDVFGNMYISDWGNNVIRKVTNVSVGINQISQVNESLNIYPNPSSGIVNVQINSNTENASYKVYNLIGKEVKAGNLTYISNKVDLSEFDNGMYTIVVSSKDGVSNSKVSLQK
jgi:trimeric autotransporter adhesin